MDILELTGENCRLHMRFEKKLYSAQGMGIWADRAFVLYHTGMCGVYDLKSGTAVPLDLFPLGSYNEGTPTVDYANHANQCMFSGLCLGDNSIPLLYVTAGKGTGLDADGYFYRCVVENIRLKDGKYCAQTVQTITFAPEGLENTPFQAPCWGCPSFLPDTETGSLYIFSARFRTTRAFLDRKNENAYIITRFPLPDPAAGGLVRLTARNILDQFTVPFDVLFTQGGTIRNGKLYYTFGFPAQDYPLAMRVYDLQKKCLAARVDLSGSAMGDEEIECCAFWGNTLLCDTCQGGIYAVQEGVFPL